MIGRGKVYSQTDIFDKHTCITIEISQLINLQPHCKFISMVKQKPGAE